MLIHFSVILSEAKDLIAACNRHEILRCAQDDNDGAPHPATNVSATSVFRRPKAAAEIALIPRTGSVLGRRLREPRIGGMIFSGHPRPATNVPVTSVFRRPKAAAEIALIPRDGVSPRSPACGGPAGPRGGARGRALFFLFWRGG